MAYRERPGSVKVCFQQCFKDAHQAICVKHLNSCACAGILVWLCAIGSVMSIQEGAQMRAKAKAWEAAYAWRQATCEVLAAGVSCTDTETRSTCFGYQAGSMPTTQPPVFLTEEIAVCPGTYWCAKEQETCNCSGEITYAPELFDGEIYTVPEVERAYKVISHGPWLCGTNQSGKPYEIDPAPWHVKHCWCTPDGILEILKRNSAAGIHKKECAETANFDFWRPSQGRLLQSEEGNRQEETLEDEGAGEEEDEDDEEGSTPARKLRDSRRRRTFSYTPWAVVSISGQDAEFSDEMKLSSKHVSCAYEYGLPSMSSNFYKSDGPYSGDVWRAEDVAKQWGNVSSRPCWVRAQGESGERLAACAVALEQPTELKKAIGLQQSWHYKLLWWELGIGMLFLPVIWLCGVTLFFSLREMLGCTDPPPPLLSPSE
mmetsp:Transcript_61648/g.144554  ORF Transcript_61648/g.144554 Transcript_61648/m.144554 type:complete len:429 (+) Transcript_61648:38-1324(+)